MQKHKLLLLDDEENILRTLKRLFEEDEVYEVHTATNSEEGIKLLEKHDFSLIISDYRMPNINGVEFLKISKEKSPDTIRIILTGFADVNVAITAINEGEIYKFIQKPWGDENLMVQVKRALEHYDLIKEREMLLDKIKLQNTELKGLNEDLESKVAEKTIELKDKVKELEGRDKVLSFFLNINTMEDVLDLIAEVLIDLTGVHKMVIYVSDKENKLLEANTGCLKLSNKNKKITKELKDFPSLHVPGLKIENFSVIEGQSSLNVISEYIYFLPIEKDGIVLGGFLADDSQNKRSVTQKKIAILKGFTSLAALAINEKMVMSNLPEWQNSVKDYIKKIN